MSLDTEFIAQLAAMETDAGLAALETAGLSTEENATILATHARNHAELDLAIAGRLLSLATGLANRLGNSPSLRGQIDYAQARLYLEQGNAALAETSLRAAQSAWLEIDDSASLARSRLGLTQILTLQGRYAEAEASCRQAISELSALAAQEIAFAVPLLMAHNNLITQLSYQERHKESIVQSETALAQISTLLALPELPSQLIEELNYWQGAIEFSRATALLSVDQPTSAESALNTAIATFDQLGDALSHGKAESNLAMLLSKTGRYADALRHFDIASQLLLGENLSPGAADLARSALLLEQATTYLAINLLSEAGSALERCEKLYRAADQPYELAQSLLIHGMVRSRLDDVAGARILFEEAERLFSGLGNHFWRNRTQFALATIASKAGDLQSAVTTVDSVIAQSSPVAVEDDGELANQLRLDISTLTEARLLRIDLHLRQSEVAAAEQLATNVADVLQTLPLPHFQLRLYHALGKINVAKGNREDAQQNFEQAISLLESQRSTLPVEEIRTAFLADKSDIYADLVLLILDAPHPAAVEDAYAVIERARSRALLERLLTTLSAEPAQGETTAKSRSLELQQQLHWLYNRLLNDPGSRSLDVTISEEIRTRERLLQQLEWQQSPALLQARPVRLVELQNSLAENQQALTFFMAGDEVMLFLSDRNGTHVTRNLCSVADLERAQSEWRFQLGRAEMAGQYMQRHAQRFENAWRSALLQLYRLLIEPIRPLLTHDKLLILPYGSLHLLPFHALWNGVEFLLEHFEFSYAPSASLAVQIADHGATQQCYRSLAAFAITDPAIPAARQEVESAGECFASAKLYIDETATQKALQEAVQSADVLHLATHGLFRPDNAFFSALKLADGWLDVHDIYRLPMATRLVVLSACESGAGQVHGGDEVIGLARGFLGAGAETVVASLWNVHDASSAELMAQFYRSLPEQSTPIAALRTAQLEAVKRKQHPYYWASYFVIGT